MAMNVYIGRIKKIKTLQFKVKNSKFETGFFLMGSHSKMRQTTVEVHIITKVDPGVTWMPKRTVLLIPMLVGTFGNTAMCHGAMVMNQSF